MNEISATWNEQEKQRYLLALSYVLHLDSRASSEKREFMRKKARELGCLISKLPKIRSQSDLVNKLAKIVSIKMKRVILRDMILLSTADNNLGEKEISEIYDIAVQIGIKSEKVDDFFLWAARGLEWQVDGTRLIDEDI